MNRTYLRGDMYFADLGTGVGSEQEGYRPVVIIQNNTGNRHSPTVIVAAITSQSVGKAKLPTHTYIGSVNGLERPSIILLEQLRTIDKRRLGSYIGRLGQEYMDGLDHALAVSVDLRHYVSGTMVMNLCGPCAKNFCSADGYILWRTGSELKEACTYCGQRRGHEYIVGKKGR